MAKLKAKQDVVLLTGTLKNGSVIDNTSTDVSKITFKDNGGSTYTIDAASFKSQFDSVPDTTATSVNMDKSQLTKNVEGGLKNVGRSIQIGGALGLAGGLGLAYYKKSKVGGYIGWGILFSVVGAGLGLFLGGKKALGDVKKLSGGSTSGGASKDTTSTSAPTSLSDKYLDFAIKTAKAMAAAFGMTSADSKKMDDEFNAKKDEIKKGIELNIAKLSADEKGAVGDYLDYNINLINNTKPEDYTNQKVTAENDKKTDDFLASLKKKYNGVDVEAVMSGMMGEPAAAASEKKAAPQQPTTKK